LVPSEKIIEVKQPTQTKNKLLTYFSKSINAYPLPKRFPFPFKYEPHPLCLMACKELQDYLKHQREWEHNFGLVVGKKGKIIGKMFGVLLVETEQKEIGYLAAFSGKLAGGNHHSKFVPPVFDGLEEGGFLNNGMAVLNQITKKIKTLEELAINSFDPKLVQLKKQRKNTSIALQEKLFDHYHFLNQAGEKKSLRAIFKNTIHKNPPSGAGECAAPKLLQYAFQHKMKPLSIAEFWWGQSPKSDYWKHTNYYPVCIGKCAPILAHMLSGIEVAEKPF